MFAFFIAFAAVAAQDLNFTVTFSRAELSTCGSANQAQGIAFSTATIPDRFTCFNLDDIFGQNVTSGVRNSSNPPISWVVRNGEGYDPSANYSRVLYQQTNATINDRGDASRAFNTYNGRSCIQAAPGPENGVAPWFGWSCQSDADGDCYNLPYGVQSFSINSRNPRGQCWDFAYNGDASRLSKTGLIFISVIVTLFFVLQ